MASFDQHIERVKKLDQSTVTQALFDFIRSIESELVELNRKQLNEKSKDVYGDAIGFYSYATEVITKGRKKEGEPFDAKDTGSLLDKMYARIEKEMIVFGSTDNKVELIMDSDNWLSKDLFGLTDDDLRMVIDNRIRPFIIDYNRKMLGL